MTVITIFGTIGSDFTASGFKATLDQIDPALPLIVQINSPGGSVQDASAIYNMLVAWPGGVTVDVVGWAVSAASFVAMAGRRIRMATSALMMIHSPWISTSGNADDLRSTAATLDVVARTLAKAYGRCGQPAQVVLDWMASEKWFDAEQAVASGLADEILASAPVAAFNDIGAVMARYSPSAPIRQRIYAMPQAQNTPATKPVRTQADTDQIVASFSGLTRSGCSEAVQRVFMATMQDNSIMPDVFGQRMLVALGADSESVAGWYNPDAAGTAFGSDRRCGDFVAAATDTLLARAGIAVPQPHPASRDLARMSVASMAERVLSMHGMPTRDKSGAELIQAALTTSDFPGLLTAVTGRSLRAGYDAAPATHALWTAEREVADFRPQSLLALSEAPGLELVHEGAEYKTGVFSEAAESFAVETFGRLVTITRQSLINDDLGAFTRIPLAYGASARRLEADLVYGKLIANPVLADGVALFHANHGNLAGTGTALSVASLGAARAAMRRQKGIGSLEFIDPAPAFLIVPVTLETAAEGLLASLANPSISNSGAANPQWIRNLTLVADPRLDAASLTAWYLAAAPTQIETIIRAYLQGEDRPYIEDREEFVRDAVSHKCRLDIGVGAIDFRGLYKNSGA